MKESCTQEKPSVPNTNDLSPSILMQHTVGSCLLMLLHHRFHQDGKPAVRKMTVAENFISHGPPSFVVCLFTSCHSIALNCLSVWGLPAVMETCINLLAKMFFMEPETQSTPVMLVAPLPLLACSWCPEMTLQGPLAGCSGLQQGYPETGEL